MPDLWTKCLIDHGKIFPARMAMRKFRQAEHRCGQKSVSGFLQIDRSSRFENRQLLKFFQKIILNSGGL
jgi:hypothetical protein